MTNPEEHLFDGYCDYLERVVQEQYSQTEEFRAMQQRVDENYARVCELAADNPEWLSVIREWENSIVNLHASRETQNLKALIKEIHR